MHCTYYTNMQVSVHLNSSGSFLTFFLVRLHLLQNYKYKNLVVLLCIFFTMVSVFHVFSCLILFSCICLKWTRMDLRIAWDGQKGSWSVTGLCNTSGMFHLVFQCQLNSRWWNFPFGVIISTCGERTESHGCQKYASCILKIAGFQ